MDDLTVQWLKKAAHHGSVYERGNKGIDTHWLGLGAWARSGFNVLHPSSDAAAQMACTSGSAFPGLRLPFPAVMVILPESIFGAMNGVLLVEDYCVWDDGSEPTCNLHAMVLRVPGAAPESWALERWTWEWGQGPRTRPSDAFFWSGPVTKVGALELDGDYSPGHRDIDIAIAAIRTAVNYVAAWSAFRESSTRSTVQARTGAGRSQKKDVAIWRLFRSIHVSDRSPGVETARAIVQGRTPPGLHLVRGHFKRLGVSKQIGWVAPYLRGEGDEAEAKVYRL